MSIKFILMLILLVAGMGCIMSAKVSFQKRQLTTPDNVWSEKEKQLRKIGYGRHSVQRPGPGLLGHRRRQLVGR